MLTVTQTPFDRLMSQYHQPPTVQWQLQQWADTMLATGIDPVTPRMMSILAQFGKQSQMVVGEVLMPETNQLEFGLTLITPQQSMQLKYRYTITTSTHRLELIQVLPDGNEIVITCNELGLEPMW